MSISCYVEECQRDSIYETKETNDNEEGDLISYCREFINSHFYGERTEGSSSLDIKNKESMRGISLTFNMTKFYEFNEAFMICTNAPELDSLNTILQVFHLMLTSNEDEKFLGTEDIIFQQLIVTATLRKRPGEKMNTCFKRLVNDCKRFLIYYNKEAATKEKVLDAHWGSRQQLRSGKVITDHICRVDEQPMDPIFGVLLCPYAGQVDQVELSKGEFENSIEAKSYHKVMFDAFDFLKKYHNSGPGPDYLGSFTLLDSGLVSAETTSLLFWERQLNRIKEEGIELEEKYF